MQLLIFHYKNKQNRYADFLLQLLMELLLKQNVSIHETNSLTEAKRAITKTEPFIIIHQNKKSLSFFSRFQLRSIIVKKKVQLVVQLNTNTPLHLSTQQLIALKEIEKWKYKKLLSSSTKIVVDSIAAKQKLTSLFNVSEQNIQIIPLAADAVYQPVDWPKKQAVKMQYSQGKEYFFAYTEGKTMNELMSLLKAFSAFKKWQHSSMKLLIFGTFFFVGTKDWNEKLNTYKYRDDIVLINAAADEKVMLLASSYLFIHVPLYDEDVLPLLQAMQCETPCISFFSKEVKEYTNEAAILVEQKNYEQLGEKMILLYKDETLRSGLIENGKVQTQLYSKENAMQALKTALPASLFG